MLKSADETMGPEVPSFTLGPPSPSWIDLSVGSPTGLDKADRRCLETALVDDFFIEETSLAAQNESPSELAYATVKPPAAQRSLLKRSQVPYVSSKQRLSSVLSEAPKTKKKSLKRSSSRRSSVQKSVKRLIRAADPVLEPIEKAIEEPLIAWDEDLLLITKVEVPEESGSMRTVQPLVSAPDMERMDTEEFMHEFWGDLLEDLPPTTNDSLIEAAQPSYAPLLTAPATPAARVTHNSTPPSPNSAQPSTNSAQLNTNSAPLNPESAQFNLADLMSAVTDDQLMELSAFLDPEVPATPAAEPKSQLLTISEASATTVNLGALLQDSEIVFNETPAAPAVASVTARPSEVSPSTNRHPSSQSVVTSVPHNWAETSSSRYRHDSQLSYVTASPSQSRHVSGQSYTTVSSSHSRHTSGQSWTELTPPDSVASFVHEANPTHYIIVLPTTEESVADIQDLVGQHESAPIGEEDPDDFATPVASPRGRNANTSARRRTTKRPTTDATPSASKKRSRAAPEEAIGPAEKYRKIRDNNNIASRRSRQQRKEREGSMAERLDELTKENGELKSKAEVLERLLEQVKALAPLLTARK